MILPVRVVMVNKVQRVSWLSFPQFALSVGISDCRKWHCDPRSASFRFDPFVNVITTHFSEFRFSSSRINAHELLFPSPSGNRPNSHSISAPADAPYRLARRIPFDERNDPKGWVATSNLVSILPNCTVKAYSERKRSLVKWRISYSKDEISYLGTYNISLSSSTFSRVNATIPSTDKPSSIDSNNGSRSPK